VAIALARSYAAVPAMGILAPQAIGAKVAGLGSWVVEGSMLLVAPAILTGLLIDLLMLVVARTAPAIQLMAVALPIKTLVGLTVLAAVTHHHAPALAALVERARSEIESVLGLMSPMTS
jgi:flagellar biosynthesis protein FliR